jgi:hypothetical protein
VITIITQQTDVNEPDHIREEGGSILVARMVDTAPHLSMDEFACKIGSVEPDRAQSSNTNHVSCHKSLHCLTQKHIEEKVM